MILGLALLAGPTSGLTPSTLHLSAPYLHTQVTLSPTTVVSGNCKGSAATRTVAWNATSGLATGTARAVTHSCSPIPVGVGAVYSSATAEIQVAFPIKVSTGHHNLSVSASYNLTVSTVMKGTFHCPFPPNTPGTPTSRGCFTQLAATARWWINLYDATNRSLLGGLHSWVQGPSSFLDVTNFTSCNGAGSCGATSTVYGCSNSSYYWANCVPSGSVARGSNTTWIDTANNCGSYYFQRCSGWQNWTLNGSHTYWVLVTFFEYTFSDLYHYPGGDTLIASINGSGGPSSGLRVTSVTVT